MPAPQEINGRKAPMGPHRREATVQFAPANPDMLAHGGKLGAGLTFAQIKPTIIELLKKHGSAKVTTLAGIEVSVRLDDERELDAAEALLKQVLTEGPVDIRGPADLLPPGEVGTLRSSKPDIPK
jgi:hypothetical protein